MCKFVQFEMLKTSVSEIQISIMYSTSILSHKAIHLEDKCVRPLCAYTLVMFDRQQVHISLHHIYALKWWLPLDESDAIWTFY
jgi:hypothetical protein